MVRMMNPGCMEASALWIPPVSTHDEITNVGFSLAIVKILEPFTFNYTNVKVTKNELNLVIKISGPLHITFHMLQSIFTM